MGEDMADTIRFEVRKHKDRDEYRLFIIMGEESAIGDASFDDGEDAVAACRAITKIFTGKEEKGTWVS